MNKRAYRLALAILGGLALVAALLAGPVAGATTANGASAPANLPYLFAAFGVVWLFFFGYTYYAARHQEDLERRVYELKQAVEGQGPREE